MMILAIASFVAGWLVFLIRCKKSLEDRAFRGILGSVVSTQIAGFAIGHLRGFSIQSIMFMSAAVALTILVVTLGQPTRIIEPEWIRPKEEVTTFERRVARRYQVTVLIVLAVAVIVYTFIYG